MVKKIKQYNLVINGRFLIRDDFEFCNEYKNSYLSVMPNSKIEIQEI